MELLLPYSVYIEVILPLALPNNYYTYAVPNHLESDIKIGKRVEVQFGKSKIYSAIISNIHGEAPKDYHTKEISAVIDEQPILSKMQLEFWNWIATYYMCTMGDVMQAALPAYLKLDSETIYIRNKTIDYKTLSITDDAFLVCEAFEFQDVLKYKDIQNILQKKTVHKVLKELIQHQILYIEENVETKYKAKTEVFIEWSDKFKNPEKRREVFNLVKDKNKQEQILLAYTELSKTSTTISKKKLLERSGVGVAVLQSMIKKNIFVAKEIEIDRIAIDGQEDKNTIQLSAEQEEAFHAIQKHFAEQQTVLLHGVTSSGKTLIYTQLIKNNIDQQKQVLFLLPEIALTTQLILRLKNWLGNIAVYHSKLSNAERVEIWNRVLNNEIKIIVGARSALLLPFQTLSLVVVDEEHDASYKQQEPNPRYHARDAALYLAKMHQANIILGSATPSFESYYNCKQKKYALVELNNRYNDVPLPDIKFINLKEAKKNKEIVSGISYQLKNKISETLNNQKQVILFQNRRGFAPFVACKTCDWIPMCKNCDITLTYHKYTNDLRCHYCGYTETNSSICKACGSHELEQKGIGTERIEEDLKTIFPDAKIGRMDYDTVRGKSGYEKIIQSFQNKELDILVGTQMVTKGLDFQDVQLVGVLNADNLLYFPDFRSIEKTYQLLTQVSGRAGRKDIKGNVFIQMTNTEHPIVQAIMEQNFYTFYQNQIAERKVFLYPPFSRLIKIILKHKDINTTNDAANNLATQLKNTYTTWVKGPIKPIAQRINNLYIREILIKIPRTHFAQLHATKLEINNKIQSLYQFQQFKNIIIIKDVDVV